MSTLGDKIKTLRETEGQAAVFRALAGYLRLRYLPRDSTPASTKISLADGRSVPEDIVEMVANDLERDAVACDKDARAILGTEVVSGR